MRLRGEVTLLDSKDLFQLLHQWFPHKSLSPPYPPPISLLARFKYQGQYFSFI